MNDETFFQLKRQLIADPEFTDFIRSAFKEALETSVSLHVLIESTKKKCTICGSAMFLRASKKDGGYFWGCGSYPRCRGLEQATKLDVEEFAEKYPDQFAVLKAQHDSFEEQKAKNQEVEQAKADFSQPVGVAKLPTKKRKTSKNSAE